MNIISVFKLFLDLLIMLVLLLQILLVYNAQLSYQKYSGPLPSLKYFSIIQKFHIHTAAFQSQDTQYECCVLKGVYYTMIRTLAEIN